jgi:aminoglycoside phosphotransferase (APT) family kinase protein
MRSLLEQLIAGAHPDRQHVTVEHISEIKGGWETAIYRFDVSYEADGAVHTAGLVGRFYPGSLGPERATREAAVLGAVAGTGTPVPRVVLHSSQPSPFGTAVLITAFVPGLLLLDVLQAGDAPVEEMARRLVELHRIPVSAVFNDRAAPFAEPGFVSDRPEAIAEAADRHGLSEFQPLIAWLKAEAPAEQHEPSVLHNDYHPGNLIVTDRGDLVILDWSFAGLGDHRLDLAWSALWTGEMAGDHTRAAFLAAYEAAAGRPIVDLDYFEALKLGTRLLTVSLWLRGAVVPPVHKITAEAIRGDYRPTVLTVYGRFREVTGIRLPVIEQL